jgi:ammonium transporter, Amt family
LLLNVVKCRFGWYGFNGGSALLTTSPLYHEVLALAATNTTLAGGAGGISALMVNLWFLERYTGEPYFDVKKAMNGSLAGMVAITGSCGVVEPWAAVVIGLIAGVFYLISSNFLIRIRVDDACDAIPVHGFCGFWGVIAAGLFSSPTRLSVFYGHGRHPGIFYSWYEGNSDFRLLGTQIVGAFFIMGWVFTFMLPFFVWLDWKGWFRSDPLEELVGLDTSYHGGMALLSSHSEIKPEYISAFKERQYENNTLRRRQQKSLSFENRTTKTSSSINQQYGDEEDEVEEKESFGSKIAL